MLANNGRASAGKGSKHVDIGYFFVTNRIEKKHIKFQYYPTLEMLADFFTKPLQGALFYKFRDAIKGVNMDYVESYKRRYLEVLEKYNLLDEKTENKFKECVENKNSRIMDNNKVGRLRSAGQLEPESRLIQNSPLQDTTKMVGNKNNDSYLNTDNKKERTGETRIGPMKGNNSKKRPSSHFSSKYSI